MTLEDVAILILGLLSVLTAVAVVVLSVEVGRLMIRLDPSRSELALVPGEGLRVGERIPRVDLHDFPTGESVQIEASPAVIVFLASSCEPCRKIGPALPRLIRRYKGLQVVRVVADDPLGFDSSRDEIDRAQALVTVFDNTGEVSTAWGVQRTPFAYVVWGGLVRSKGVVNTFEQLLTLLEGHGLPAPSTWHRVAEVAGE